MQALLFVIVAVLSQVSSSVFGVNLDEQELFTSLSLHAACKNNDAELLRNLICQNASLSSDQSLDSAFCDVNATDEEKNTPLHIACQEGFQDCVDLLLRQPGIAVNRQNKNGATPLLLACNKGNNEIIEKLLNRQDINVNQANEAEDNFFPNSPLFVSCCANNLEVVKKLMLHPNIDLKQKYDDGYYFEWILNSGSLECLTWLLNSDFKQSLIATSNFSARICQNFFDHVMEGTLCGEAQDIVEQPILIWQELINSLDTDLLNTSSGFSNGKNLLLFVCSKFKSKCDYPKELLKIVLERADLDIAVANEFGLTSFHYLFWHNRGDLMRILLSTSNAQCNLDKIIEPVYKSLPKLIALPRCDNNNQTKLKLNFLINRTIFLYKLLKSFQVNGKNGLDVEVENNNCGLCGKIVRPDRFVVKVVCCNNFIYYDVLCVAENIYTQDLAKGICPICSNFVSLEKWVVGISTSFEDAEFKNSLQKKRCLPPESENPAKRVCLDGI